MKKMIALFALLSVLAGSFSGCAKEVQDVDTTEHADTGFDLTTVGTASVVEETKSPDAASDLEITDTQTDVKETEAPVVDPDSYAFDAQYIRTNGGYDTEYASYVLIESKAELEAYYEANKMIFDLKRKEKVYSDTTIGFLDACDKYDDAYFETKNLLLIVLVEGSGSIRHEITDVRKTADGTEWVVTVKRKVPQDQTCDMATWHLFLEVQMGKVIGADDTVRVEYQ